MAYAFREVLTSFRRAPLLAALSILAMALGLFVVGLFALTAWNIRQALEQIEARVEVVAYLRDGTPAEQVRIARIDMLGIPGVRQIDYVSKDEALVTAVQELHEFRDVFTDLEVNPLPASLEIRLLPGYRTPREIERVASSVGRFDFVEEVTFGREWVEKIVALRRIAAGATAIIGGAFAAVAGIIIATAVRISVFARRDEIRIMRLVGATDGFVQRPFLLEGLLAGIAGGLIATLLTYSAFQAVSALLIELEWLPSLWLPLGIAAGAAYGLVASALAVRRHLAAV